MTSRRLAGSLVGVAFALGALILIVASIESIGLVGDAETRTSWPLFLAGVGLLAVAPAAAIRARWSGWPARRMLAAYSPGALGTVVVGIVSGSIGLGAVTGLVLALLIAVV